MSGLTETVHGCFELLAYVTSKVTLAPTLTSCPLLLMVDLRSSAVQAVTAGVAGLSVGLLDADLPVVLDGLGELDADRDGERDGVGDCDGVGDSDGDGDCDGWADPVGEAVGALGDAVCAVGVAEGGALTGIPVWVGAGAAWPGLPPRLKSTISRMIRSTRKPPTTRARRIQ